MLVVKSFATPIAWVLVLLLLGLVLTRQGGRKRLLGVGRFLLLAGTALLVGFSSKPVADWLTYLLESQYQPPPAPTLRGLDVVVVLGGGVYPSGHLRQEAELSKYTYPRFYHGVRIFKENQVGLLAFCGGPPRQGGESEADTMRGMALRLGLPEDKVIAETTSRTTFENLANLARLLPAGQGRRIGLVTSAVHMPRSHRVFVQQFPQDTVVPIPVYYTYDPRGWSVDTFTLSSGNLEQSNAALHEWIGLLWYSLRHR